MSLSMMEGPLLMTLQALMDKSVQSIADLRSFLSCVNCSKYDVCVFKCVMV